MEEEILKIDDLSSLSGGLLSATEIKVIRKSFGMTQVDFSDLLGVEYNTYRSWEGGYKHPSSPALALLHVARKYPKVFLKNRQELIKFIKQNF